MEEGEGRKGGDWGGKHFGLTFSLVYATPLVLGGVSRQWQDRLQSVLNAAAHLVLLARQSERITPLLHQLHWLKVPEWISAVCASWHIAVFMGWHHPTSLGAFI